jgi:hypothetical protein
MPVTRRRLRSEEWIAKHDALLLRIFDESYTKCVVCQSHVNVGAWKRGLALTRKSRKRETRAKWEVLLIFFGEALWWWMLLTAELIYLDVLLVKWTFSWMCWMRAGSNDASAQKLEPHGF